MSHLIVILIQIKLLYSKPPPLEIMFKIKEKSDCYREPFMQNSLLSVFEH